MKIMLPRNETWVVAPGGPLRNKIRAFLTTLGVVIGSACIVLVVTIGLAGGGTLWRKLKELALTGLYAPEIANSW